jgi:tRNA 2-(methylsulfanyl)-N6-isopentenyladenosine37 hydroxylase
MLGLTVATDPGWVNAALRDVGAVLVDHAHCEVKAAANALSLAARHPGDLSLVRALTSLAREEIDHFQRVLDLLEARGLALGPPPVDAYAAELRRASSASSRPASLTALVDRLLVGALIEARSCERFKLLAEALGDDERELRALHVELFEAEARHYRTYVDLATTAAGPAAANAVPARLAALSEVEGRIVASLARGVDRATIHG